MTGVLIGGVVLILLIAAIAVALRNADFFKGRPATAGDELGATRPRPQVGEFHVRGEAAEVYFEVPLPAGDPDPVLTELLLHEAVEVVREKRHDLPISQVTKVVAFGTRDGAPAPVGEVTLETPGELPPPVLPEHVHASRVSIDLSSAVSAPPAAAPGLADVRRDETLGTVGGELRLVGGLEAGLRTQGVDPDTMSAGDLVTAVLRLTGHTLTAGPSPDTLFAAKAGERTMVRIVDHEPGSYPELPEKEIDRFMFDFQSSGATRALLVTDKYAPFEVYDRERRERRVRFLSRERLQHFVDAVAVS